MTLPRFFAVGLVVALLAGCSATPGPASIDTAAPTPTETPAPTETSEPEALGTEPPERVIDLTCDDFAGVASIGTIAGVTERDPGAAWWDTLDTVSLADVIGNVGGLSCEFSDGGSWWIDGQGLNESWRGAAVFVVPGGGSHFSADRSPECGATSSNTFVVICKWSFAVGATAVTIVVSTNDRGTTQVRVREHVTSIISAASVKGLVERKPGTFIPPRACAELITPSAAEAIVGPAVIVTDPGFAVQQAAEATFFTGNIGCNWTSEPTSDSISALILPGGAWAAPADLSDHCTNVAQYGYWLCWSEAVVDGTWLHVRGNGLSEADAQRIADAGMALIVAHAD